ncbi:hypothetical protein QE152_g38135 [Popillia japonica]|uniref:Retroviral polymerase SH3-like domain-containing protein n=1 Tax=Popillia japonica TaxID=7064 RepID=A0AAW1I894_POPJA
MLQEALPEPTYWAEAENTAVYLKNRSPTKALSRMLPEEYCAFAHIVTKREEEQMGCKEMIMVGYCENSKAYCLINPDDPRKVEKGRNVFFIDDNKLHKRDKESSNFEEKQSCELLIEFPVKQDEIENDKTSNESNPTDDEFSPEINSSDNESGQCTSAEQREQRKHPTRERKLKRGNDMLYTFMYINAEDPRSYREAVSGRNKNQWEKAMREEMAEMRENQTSRPTSG